MTLRRILEKVVKDIANEYGIPEEKVWKAAVKVVKRR